MTNNGSLLAKKMAEWVRDRSFVEIYRDRLSKEALVGRVLQWSSTVFVMEKFDELYRDDGIAVARISDITRTKVGGRELECAPKIAGQMHHSLLPEVALLELSAALTMLQRQFGQVTIHVEHLDPGVCFIGEEIELDDDFILLRQFGTLKTLDRSELLVRLDEITRVEANGQYERHLVERFR